MADSKTQEPNTETQTEAAARRDRYDPQAIEQKWFERWAQNPDLYRAEASHQRAQEVLRAGDAAVSLGRAAHGARAQLLHRRRAGALHVDAGPQRASSHGLGLIRPSRRERGHPEPDAAAGVDAGQHRQNEGADEAPGFAYDWSNEVTTCLPEYYRWNQWFFLKFLERGLAYRKKSKVNWCPQCATVLANEQVLPNGCCWRHETTLVEQRELEQWFLRITNYADELLQGLDNLPGWPEKVRTMQRNWIGRSEGTLVDFKLDGAAGPAGDKITVFTTRVDTIFGATSLQLGARASHGDGPDRQRSRPARPRSKT